MITSLNQFTNQNWEQNAKVAQSVLFGYVKLKPIYNIIVAEIRKNKVGVVFLKFNFRKVSETIDLSFENISFDINELAHLISMVWKSFSSIPSDTKMKFISIYAKSLPSLALQLLKDRRTYKDNSDDSNIYSLRLHVFKRFAYFIYRDKTGLILTNHFLNLFINRRNSIFYWRTCKCRNYLVTKRILAIWDSYF